MVDVWRLTFDGCGLASVVDEAPDGWLDASVVWPKKL